MPFRRPFLVLLIAASACGGASEGTPDASMMTDASLAAEDARTTSSDAGEAGPDAALETADGGARPDASAPGADAALERDDAATPGPDAALALDAGAPTLGALSVAQLHAALAQKDFLLINVHVPFEGNIPGTDKNLTYTDVDAIAAYIGTDLDTPVVIYCKSNYMSTLAGPKLVSKGYRAVRYLDGGMNAWTAAGFSLDR